MSQGEDLREILHIPPLERLRLARAAIIDTKSEAGECR